MHNSSSPHTSDPEVEIVPPMVVVTPDSTQVSLRCLPSSPQLTVVWNSSLVGLIERAEGLEVTLTVPEGGLSDGIEIMCSILEPDNTQRTVSSSSIFVRNIPSK